MMMIFKFSGKAKDLKKTIEAEIKKAVATANSKTA